ncbi:Fc.00g010690.m01.CDS01 [Cosmosporella sp. VM-42]
MPSTEFFGYTVTNVGPLTTTFTAEASCATATQYQAVAYADNFVTRQAGRLVCPYPTLGNCYPSGEVFDDIGSKASKSLGQGYFPYFSPASLCPSGWTTAGVLASAGESNSASMSAAGIFTEDLWPYDNEGAQFAAAALPAATIFANILDPSETLVWCCPSGHTVNIYGGCISSVRPLATHRVTELCLLVYPSEDVVTVTSFHGSAWTPPLISITPAETQLETLKETISADEASSYAIIHSYPIVALVHQASDSAGSGDAGKGKYDDDGKSKDGEGNAASMRGLSLIPFGVVAIGVLAGAGLLIPW